jgi:hypothetical protein
MLRGADVRGRCEYTLKITRTRKERHEWLAKKGAINTSTAQMLRP